jgi:Gpi18-like mannosyltransferase
MKRAPAIDIIGLFLITRIALIFITYFGFILLTQSGYSGTPIYPDVFLQLWNRWDSITYVHIAQSGYTPPYDFAFFPLLPLMIALLGAAFGTGSDLLVGILISNIAFLAALFVIYQLAVDIAGEQAARRTLLYLCIFPTAFYFFASYNESLFVLLSASTFLALRRQRWWLAGLLGALAALTRSAGVLLAVPYLYELWSARESLLIVPRRLIAALVCILLIPLGTLLYCYYCWHVTGNPLEFAAVQSHWGRHFTWPWIGISHSFYELFFHQPFGSFYQVHNLLDLSATVGFLALTILGWKKLRPSYTLWLVLLFTSILFSSSIQITDALVSNQRFVIEMFPAFITLAMLGIRHPRLHNVIIWAFPALLGTLSLIFILGKWMV